MQTKATVRYHFTSIRIAIEKGKGKGRGGEEGEREGKESREGSKIKFWQGCEETETLVCCQGTVKPL